MKKCPFCAEEIQDDALKCRFCGEDLKKKKWPGCFTGCLLTVGISILAALIVFSLGLLMVKLLLRSFIAWTSQFPFSQDLPVRPDELGGVIRQFMENLRGLWERLFDSLGNSPKTLSL